MDKQVCMVCNSSFFTAQFHILQVVFLVVDRQLYNKSIKSFQAKQLALVRGFVTQHPFFEHWPPKLQSQVQNSVTQVHMISYLIENDTHVQ